MHGKQRARTAQQRRVRRQVENSDARALINLFTGPDLLDKVESVLPPHRERLFPPTETLSMFLSQALSSDRSCDKGAIVKSGVQSDESGGGLVDLCHLDPIFEFDPDHQLRQVIETA